MAFAPEVEVALVKVLDSSVAPVPEIVAALGPMEMAFLSPAAVVVRLGWQRQCEGTDGGDRGGGDPQRIHRELPNCQFSVETIQSTVFR
jgi:hypothetical protein